VVITVVVDDDDNDDMPELVDAPVYDIPVQTDNNGVNQETLQVDDNGYPITMAWEQEDIPGISAQSLSNDPQPNERYTDIMARVQMDHYDVNVDEFTHQIPRPVHLSCAYFSRMIQLMAYNESRETDGESFFTRQHCYC
jgi:hypothetical protein